MNAPGDFAQAYVIAHEVGHHLQKLMGITNQVDRLRGQMSTAEFNKYSVRLELQADFLAGVWAHHSQEMTTVRLQPGDLQEALNAAYAIGDDRLQKQQTGRVLQTLFHPMQPRSSVCAGLKRDTIPATWNREILLARTPFKSKTISIENIRTENPDFCNKYFLTRGSI